MNGFREKLDSILGEEQVFTKEPMSRHTTMRVGGEADYFVTPSDMLQIKEVVGACREADIPYYVVGNGSNILVSDKGFSGVIIALGNTFGKIERKGLTLIAQSGALLSKIAGVSAAEGLAGFEFAGGIPGSLGGAVTMNAGAYGGEMSQVVEWAKVLTKEGGFLTLMREEMAFSYRSSRPMQEGWIVLEAGLLLSEGDPDRIRALIDDYNLRRKEKQPLEYPSAGSTFKRPKGYFAGKLIQDAGLGGYRLGGAEVSEKHCGFVINRENATASDVYRLCNEIKAQVFQKFHVQLEMEVKLLGEF